MKHKGRSKFWKASKDSLLIDNSIVSPLTDYGNKRQCLLLKPLYLLPVSSSGDRYR